MRFAVLGSLQVVGDDGPVRLRGERQRVLLLRLLAGVGRTVSAHALIDAVWGADLPVDPANALQYQVAQLRKVLEPQRPRGAAPNVLLTAETGYRLAVDASQVDAGEFAAAVAAARAARDAGHAEDVLAHTDAALPLWRGAPYADAVDHEFARPEIARLEALRREAVALRADALIAAGRAAEAVAELEALVAEHPAGEHAWTLLIRALAAAGRQAEALDGFHRARRELRERAGIEPGRELQQVQRAILTQHPEVVGVPVVLEVAGADLPTPTTALVGRDQLVAEIETRLDAARLVTLHGPGGHGKTRLAIAVARRWQRHGRRVVMVPFDGIGEDGLVGGALAAATGMREDPTVDQPVALARYLDGGPTLLLLDNCEHVVAGVADMMARLLRHTSDVTLLVTSQARLGLRGEVVVEVPPLRTAVGDGLAVDLAAAPAVRLFIDRVRDHDPDYRPDERDLAAIAALVTALGGSPLAIELAATRARVTAVVDLAAHADDLLGRLRSTDRDVPDRQRSLDRALAWSHGLLDADEQAALDALAVYVGPFTVADAAEVLDVAEERAVDLVARLADRSALVRCRGVDGRPRFRPPDALRQYVRRHADPARIRVAAARHLDQMVALATAGDDGIRGAGQLDWLARLDAAHDDLRAALRAALARRDVEAALTITLRLGRYWDWRGHVREGARWTDETLAATEGRNTPGRGALMAFAGFWAHEHGDADGALHRADRAYDIALRSGDSEGVLLALATRGIVLRHRGHAALARAVAADTVARADDAGDRWGAAWAETLLALTFGDLGRAAAARRTADAATQRFVRLGDRRGEGWAMVAVAEAARAGDALDEAATAAETAVALSCEVGDDRNVTWALEILADLARRTGAPDRAARLLDRSRQLWQARGIPASPTRRGERSVLLDAVRADLADARPHPRSGGE